MGRTLRSLILILPFLLLISTSSHSQTIQKDDYNLDLTNKGRKIENILRLYISDSQYDNLKSTTGEKVNIRSRLLIINGDTIKPKDIGTRGQSTLMFRRKSLSISLKSNASFRHGDKTESLNKFSLLNLSMDKYYCRNSLAFEIMKRLGLFNLFYSFCELQINDRSEGIFMIMETPENWALRDKKSPLVLRRGYDHEIEKTKNNKKYDRNSYKKYLNDYNQLYRSLDKDTGEGLYTILSEYIDLENYMKWLAFNFFVHNGDYSDEVFFYVDAKTGKFKIIPWDYDDIFAIKPHEGAEKSKNTIGNKLIFSSEDLLDVKIANDPYLYSVYLKTLKELLNNMTIDVLRQAFENTYSELFPYYNENEIIINSQYDSFKNANLETLKSDLKTLFISLNGLRDSYLQGLEKQ